MLKMLLKKIMKAEAMFISSMDPESEPEISGGRKAEPHAFPWYLLIPVLNKKVLRQFPTDYLPFLG